MDHDQLMILISKDQLEEAINLLLEFVNKRYTRFSDEVYHISGRFNKIEKEKRLDTIARKDYDLELNSIRESLLYIVKSIKGLNEAFFKVKEDTTIIREKIAHLEIRFEKCRKKSSEIKSNNTRLREKNEIARQLSQIFIDFPELIQAYYATDSEAVISGISNRYKRLPEPGGIDFFESIPKTALGNFTKCCIANALAEILYSGQLGMGDDRRIARLLDELFPNSYQTVRLNITRVSAELDYFTGNF